MSRKTSPSRLPPGKSSIERGESSRMRDTSKPNMEERESSSQNKWRRDDKKSIIQGRESSWVRDRLQDDMPYYPSTNIEIGERRWMRETSQSNMGGEGESSLLRDTSKLNKPILGRGKITWLKDISKSSIESGESSQMRDKLPANMPPPPPPPRKSSIGRGQYGWLRGKREDYSWLIDTSESVIGSGERRQQLREQLRASKPPPPPPNKFSIGRRGENNRIRDKLQADMQPPPPPHSKSSMERGESSRMRDKLPVDISPPPNKSLISVPIDRSPALEIVWRGNFEILDSPSELMSFCEVITAHTPGKVSSRAYWASQKLPGVIQFRVYDQSTHMPHSFVTKCPGTYDIALYFFPNSKHDKSKRQYALLLKFLEKKGCMLRSRINETLELLVFPSTMLDADSNTLDHNYFMWGVFRCISAQKLTDKVQPTGSVKRKEQEH